MTFNPKCPKLPWMVDFFTSHDAEVLKSQLAATFANTTLEYLSSLSIKSQPPPFRATQLMCSMPPAATCNTIEQLMGEGMSAVRITAANPVKILELVSKIRAVNNSFSRKLSRIYPMGIAVEIKGPEIRTGTIEGSRAKIFLDKGKVTTITTDPSYEEHVTEDMIFVDYQRLPEVVQPGDRVLLDNGVVTLSAIECVESVIRCIVERAGNLLSNASVVVPNAPLELPMISSSDKALLEICLSECVDYIFISGIYNKDNILEVKDILGKEGETILLIPKIENSVAIDNIDEIIKVADAVCVDCERLMVELPRQKVFLVQKAILAKCNLAGKPCMCTVRFADLNSFSKSEVCDIANAIIDGTDSLLISHDACTKEVLQFVNVICKEAEPAVHQRMIFKELTDSIGTPMEAIYSLAISAVEASLKCNAAAIICLTSTGRTAKILSRFRPRCPIITITRYARVARQLRLYKGVEPLVYLKAFEGNWDVDVDQRTQLGVTYGKYLGYIRAGDALVTICGSRPEVGMSNNMKIVYASDFDALPRKTSKK